MLNRIFFISDTIQCVVSQTQSICRSNTSSILESSVITQPSVKTQKLKITRAIETLIDFQSPLIITKYRINEDEITKNLKILFIDTSIEKNGKAEYNMASSFREVSHLYLQFLNKRSYRIEKTSSFIVSLRPEKPKSENPLINYFILHKSRAIKLHFRFSGLFNEHTVLLVRKIIDKLEQITQSQKKIEWFKEINLSFGVENSVFSCNWKTKCWLREQKNNSEIFNSEIEAEIQNSSLCEETSLNSELNIVESLQVSKDLMSDIVIFGKLFKERLLLEQQRKLVFEKMQTFETVETDINIKADIIALDARITQITNNMLISYRKIEYLNEKRANTDVGIKLQMKRAFKKTAQILIDKLHISTREKNNILNFFNREIDEYCGSSSDLIKTIIENLKIRNISNSADLIVESPVFKLNFETFILEEVKGKHRYYENKTDLRRKIEPPCEQNLSEKKKILEQKPKIKKRGLIREAKQNEKKKEIRNKRNRSMINIDLGGMVRRLFLYTKRNRSKRDFLIDADECSYSE
ncbi:hypothetical protein CDIK_0992 [Cucumispora dikerogammari]|nr:hypothetical protein CDIK_0992 [Cucumispora dikerogammari]